MKIKTELLKNMLSKLEKGMGHGKILPITDYIELEASAGQLTGTATDLTNWVSYSVPFDGEEFSLIVQGPTLIKLVGKTTVKEVELEADGEVLKFKGNGNYSIPLLDEVFPAFDFDISEQKPQTVKLETLLSALKALKSSVAVDLVAPELMGYNIGVQSLATNSLKMAIFNTKLLDTPILLTQDLANLIPLFDDKTVDIYENDDTVLLVSPQLTVFGPLLAGIENYPNLDDVTKELDFEANAVLNTKATLEILDRLSIFKEKLKVSSVLIDFTKTHVIFSNSKNSENLNYSKKTEFKAGKVELNIQYLIDIISSVDSETFELYYGNDNAIKVNAGELTFFLSLLEEGDE